MDTLSGLLDGPRANGAFLLRSILSAPWSLRIQDEAPLTVVAVVRGAAWIVPVAGIAARFHHRKEHAPTFWWCPDARAVPSG